MNHSNVYLVSLIFLHQNDLGLVYKDNFHEFHQRTWRWMISIGNQFNYPQVCISIWRSHLLSHLKIWPLIFTIPKARCPPLSLSWAPNPCLPPLIMVPNSPITTSPSCVHQSSFNMTNWDGMSTWCHIFKL